MIQNERFVISKNGLFLADDGYFVANPCKAILFIEITKAAKQFALMRNSLQPDWQNDSWHIVPVLTPFPST